MVESSRTLVRRFCTAFLVNPMSANRCRLDILQLIQRHCQGHARIEYSRSAEHLSQLAKECVREGMEIIVAVGGDGTIHRVGKELIGTSSVLAMLPIGSGNGLARHFHMAMNPEKALYQLEQGTVCSIDTVTINEESFLNIAGAGFDGHIAQAFASSHSRGFWTYLRLTFQEYFNYRPKEYTISIDGKNLCLRAFLVSVCNGSQYGNGAKIAPHAIADDGRLELVIIKPFSFLTSWKVALALLCGISSSSLVKTYTCQKAVISGSALASHVDGEPFPAGNRMSCRINPKSLKVLLPKHAPSKEQVKICFFC